MRLNTALGRGFAGRNNSFDIERVERLLRDAAGYEPDIQPVDDFIARALRGPDVTCPRRGNRILMLAGGSLAAAALLLVCFLRGHGAPPQVANSAQPGGKPAPNHYMEFQPGGEDPDAGAPPAPFMSATGRQSDIARPESRIQNAALDVPVNRRGHRRRAEDIPRVQWERETVEHYSSGVIAPAWVPESETRSGDVVYQPVMMEVPVTSGVTPMPAGADPGTTLSLASYTEEKH
jgi:hypothetical protein